MKHYLMGGAALLVLSACATKPDPLPEIATPDPEPVLEAPAPVFQEPEPEVVQSIPEPMGEVLPDPNLPTPGSEEDFA